ncbi:MAG: DUF2190 family protein [Gammaproteobacteria bacterium]|nr:DUF2190 family protein [Gammaproteobacteria bacterium]
MKNYSSEGIQLAIETGNKYYSSDLVLEENIAGVAVVNSVDEKTTTRFGGIFKLEKDSSTFVLGQAVYYNTTSNLATDDPTDSFQIGFCIEDFDNVVSFYLQTGLTTKTASELINVADINSSQVVNPEQPTTYISERLNVILDNLDSRTSNREYYEVITRTAGLISKIEYFSDAAKTVKAKERNFTYTSEKISSITDIYFNLNGTEDSRVTQSFTRDTSNLITEISSPFTTSEV